MGRRERERGVTRRGEELGPRDQLPLNQLPIDQLPTRSTPIKSTSHEINCNIIRGIHNFILGVSKSTWVLPVTTQLVS